MSKKKKKKQRITKPAVRKPETVQPETENPETEPSEPEQPETENPQTVQPEQPETENSETELPETEQPEPDNAEAVLPEAEQAETEEPKRKKSAGKILNRISTAALLLSLGLLIYVTVCIVRGKPVWLGEKCVMHVITGSMEPTLHVGDCIVIERIDPEALSEGDIICYVSEASDIKGRIVTHRFLYRQENGNLVTRGDANPVSDLEVRPDQVVGRYVRKSGFFTWTMSFGDLRKVMMLAVMLVISAIALFEVRTVVLIGKDIHEEKETDEAAERERLMREAIDREIERLKAEAAQNAEKKDGDDA